MVGKKGSYLERYRLGDPPLPLKTDQTYIGLSFKFAHFYLIKMWNHLFQIECLVRNNDRLRKIGRAERSVGRKQVPCPASFPDAQLPKGPCSFPEHGGWGGWGAGGGEERRKEGRNCEFRIFLTVTPKSHAHAANPGLVYGVAQIQVRVAVRLPTCGGKLVMCSRSSFPILS